MAEELHSKMLNLATRRRLSAQTGGREGTPATEDGDFVALRENRANRKSETLDPTTLQEIMNVNAETVFAGRQKKPSTAIEQAWSDLQGTYVSIVRSLGFRGKEFERYDFDQDAVVKTNSQNLRKQVTALSVSSKLTDSAFKCRRSGKSILHIALENKRINAAKTIMDVGGEELLCQSFDVIVNKTTGKKNALHQMVELNSLELLQLAVEKLSPNNKRNLFLQETPVEITGQRPRTFPCLHLAAFYGFKDIVLFLLDQDVEINHLNVKNDSALLWAARWGHNETVKLLLMSGALPGIANDKGSTALYWAVRYNQTETVKILVNEGNADVNQQRKLGLVAPIVLASAMGFIDIVNFLLECGADPDTTIRGGERPLHHAAREGHSDIINLLISTGADVHAVDERGDTALLLAAKHGNAKALDTLLKHAADLNHKNILGRDVWSYAVESDNSFIIRLLVLHERKIQEQFAEDEETLPGPQSGVNSLLFLAAQAGNCERMELLFKIKIDPSAVDENVENFLHHAARHNQAEVIRLHHTKVSVDAVNTHGNTALHEACRNGHQDAILELISLKAMVNIRNIRGETALHLAAYSSTIAPSTVAKLMDYVIKTHPYECLNIKDIEGNNCLHLAAKYAHHDVLWEFRFVRYKDEDMDGNLALHKSVRPGEPEALEMMLDIYDAMKRDCDINHQNDKDKTVLHLAAESGFLDSVTRLIMFGSDISVPDHEGNTVLHILTQLTVSEVVHNAKYIAIMNVIFDRSIAWYCSVNRLTVSETDHERLNEFKRQAILFLVTEQWNKEGLSVLALACKLGATNVVQKISNMEGVFKFIVNDGKSIRYDLQNVTPRTNGTLKKGICSHGSVSPKPSCLEWLLTSDHPIRTAKVLDCQPYSDIERAYSSVAFWVYAIIMVVHIIYMTFLSWSGVTLLEKASEEDTIEWQDPATITLFIIVPMEPAFILVYNIYRLMKMCCMRELSVRSQLSKQGFWAVLFSMMPIGVSIIYATFVSLWILFYFLRTNYKDYFLSIALLIGWMYTISFTRGFKLIHYFWRMIQTMVVTDIFKFLFIYMFVLLAFAFAFHIQFQVSDDIVNTYPSPFDTMFLSFNLMIGQEVLFDENIDDHYKQVGRTALFIKILYLAYMILGTIILLNLLIAMMNDSYQAILKKQHLSWRIESVQLGVEVEKSLPITFTLFSKVRFQRDKICYADRLNRVDRWFIEVDHHSSEESDGVDYDDEMNAISDLQTKVRTVEVTLTENLQALRSDISGIQNTLRHIAESFETKKGS